jgi:type I restriction enzyme M protein
MSKNYDCELCGKHFDQKCDYDKHKAKKSPCVTMEKMEEIIKNKNSSSDNKSGLTNLFKSCLDDLRDGQDILTGDKALRNLAYLLDLKLLEPQIGKEINFDDFDYNFDDMEDNVIEHNKKRLLHCVKFSNLAKENEGNIPNLMNNLWKYILSQHPKTKNIFVKEKNFDMTHQSTYKKLIKKLNEFDFTKIGNDVLGDAYGVVVAENMRGETLGQFFTPHKVTKMMVNLVDPKIKKDGKIETVFDPAMGTGGFLISSIKHIIEQANLQKIKLDWNYISNGAISGREADQDTYQLAISNMLISSGHMFNNLEKGDSIRNPIVKKYDVILANPPFGIKGLKYDEIENKLRDEYLPVKTDSAVPLFLQAIIYMLNINGRCAVVLPDGQELFSKNSALVSIREFLMKTCDLKEVISMPAGIFTNTSIKTCVFFFVKKKEGKDVLDVVVKKSKREYKFTKLHQTNKVKFYDYNPEKNEKFFVSEVDIKDLSENKYSLNYKDYIKDEKEEKEENDNYEYENLEDVCDINFGTRIVKSNNEEGEYPVYGSGRDTFTTKSYNREGYNILIGRFALSEQCARLVNLKLFLNDSGLTIKPNSDKIMHKFLGYYMYLNQNKIYRCARGTAQKNLDMDKFKKIKIPIPPLEKQKEIVEYLDFIYEKCNKSSLEKISELEKLNKYCLEMQKKYGENECKMLSDVCELKNGSQLDKKDKIDGNIPIFGGGVKLVGYHNIHNRDGTETIVCGTGAYSGYVGYNNGEKFWASQCFTIKSLNTNLLDNKYLYLYSKNILESIFMKSQKGTAIPFIRANQISSEKINIPPLEKQKEIVEYCDYNQNLINQLEKEISQNKKKAEEFMKNIIKNIKNDIDNDSDISNEDDKSQKVESKEEHKEELKTKSINDKKVKKEDKKKVVESENSSDSDSSESSSSESEKEKKKKNSKSKKTVKKAEKKKIVESGSDSDSSDGSSESSSSSSSESGGEKTKKKNKSKSKSKK